jgi:hypothetical protein
MVYCRWARNSFPALGKIVDENNHMRKVLSFNGKLLFPNAELGDVGVLVWDKLYQGDVLFEGYFEKSEVSSMLRSFFEDGIDMILPMNSLISILKKVITRENFTSIDKISTGRDVFGIPGKGILERTCEVPFEGSHKLICAREQVRYISSSAFQYKFFCSPGRN